MGLVFSKAFLKRKFSITSVLASAVGMVSRRIFKQKRKQWKASAQDNLETVLDILTAYELARGAGKLMIGCLRFYQPRLEIQELDRRLRRLLAQMDQTDDSPYDRARSRLIASKVLFYAEGFRWKACRYEQYQQDALELLRQIPLWKTLGRKQIFQAQPFAPEEIIGTTHRMLLMLNQDGAAEYIAEFLKKNRLYTDPDYMSRLLALTLNVQNPKQFEQVMLQWLKDYRDFKLKQVNQQEKWMDMSMSVISGEAPSQFGFSLLNGFLKKRTRPRLY